MADRLCAGGCGTKVNGRRKRCRPCKKAYQAQRFRERYHASRGYSEADYASVTEEGTLALVDYSVPDRAPRFRQVQVKNVRHDHALRTQLDHQAENRETGGEQDSWDNMNRSRAADATRVVFPAASPAPTINRHWNTMRDYGEMVNPAAAGMAVQPSPAAGLRALVAQQQGKRFGDNVRAPVRVSSSHLAAPPPNMVQAEQAVVEVQRTASEHARSLAGYQAWRRG
jgi:hypothetical protein